MQKTQPAAQRKIMGKVLIVEDDHQLGQWLASKLTAAGMTVTLCTNISKALEIIQGQFFHAIVADIFFDKEPAGLELIKAIEPTGTPTVVISSAADLRIAKESMNSGASYLLEKPFDPKDLINVLEKIWEEPKGLQSLIERFLDIHALTPKEKEVVRLILKGLSNKEVAAVGGNTDRTIKFHLTSIFSKCGVKSRTELFNAIFPS